MNHGETMFHWPFVAQAINFGLLLWLLARLGRRPLQEALTRQREALQAGVRESAALQAEAQQVHRQAEERLNGMEAELGRLRGQIEQTARAEAERAMAEAQQRAQRIRQEADFVVVQKGEQMRLGLQQQLAERTLAVAEQLLRGHIQADDQLRLAREALLAPVATPRHPTAPQPQVSP